MIDELASLDKEEINVRLKQLRKDKKYRPHIKNKKFMKDLQERLDIQIE